MNNIKTILRDIEEVKNLGCIVDKQKDEYEYIVKIPVPRSSLYYDNDKARFITFKITFPYNYPFRNIKSEILDTDSVIHPLLPCEKTNYPYVWTYIYEQYIDKEPVNRQLLGLVKNVLEFLNYEYDYQEICKEIILAHNGINIVKQITQNETYSDMLRCMSERGQIFTLYWLMSGKEGYEEDLSLSRTDITEQSEKSEI